MEYISIHIKIAETIKRDILLSTDTSRTNDLIKGEQSILNKIIAEIANPLSGL